MGREERIEEIRARARRNFSLGYNCAECITEAVLTLVETGLPEEAKKLATGFGGGIGLFGDTCGAVAGAVMAVSAVHGRAGLPPGDDRREVAAKAKEELYGRPGLYRLFNPIPNRIREAFGSTVCREITAPWRDRWLCREHALHCRELITEAAGIAAELALGERDALARRPFGANVEDLEG